MNRVFFSKTIQNVIIFIKHSCEPNLYAWMTIEYGTSHLKRRPQIFEPYKKRMERLKITPPHDKATVVRVISIIYNPIYFRGDRRKTSII